MDKKVDNGVVKSTSNRISELDGLRGLAVMGVMLYHYCARFSDFYPFTWDGLGFLEYGKLGVQLFFLISGFVIFHSLTRSRSFIDFVVKRGARLLPPMMVCSIITFCVMWSIDTPFTDARRVGLQGFLPSWTLTDPRIWRPLFPQAAYVDGAYWTLFYEARFYIVSAAIAFIPFFVKTDLLKKLSIFCVIVYTLRLIGWLAIAPKAALAVDFLFATQFLYLFWAGAMFQRSMTQKGNLWLYAGLAASFGLAVLFSEDLIYAFFIGLMYLAFFVFIYAPKWLSFLNNNALVFVGVSSYSIYLLHQNIGVALISVLPEDQAALVYVGSIICISALIICLGRIVFVLVERQAHRISKTILARRNLAEPTS